MQEAISPTMGIYRFVEILRAFGVSSYYLAATTRVHPTPCVSIGSHGDFEKVLGCQLILKLELYR